MLALQNAPRRTYHLAALAAELAGSGSPADVYRPAAAAEHLATGLVASALHLALALSLGWALARAIHVRRLHWSWARVALGACLLLYALGLDHVLAAMPLLGVAGAPGALAATITAMRLSRRWALAEEAPGGCDALAGGERLRPAQALSSLVARLRSFGARGSGCERATPAVAHRLVLGTRPGTRRAVSIEPRHTVVIGATGSGKTVTLRRIMDEATRTMGAIAVDGKGDAELASDIARFAQQSGRRFVAWGPHLPSTYNPFAHGSDTEIVDKALAAESWGDDYYLRLGQRFLGFAVRALRASGREIAPAQLARYVNPDNLEELAPEMERTSPGSWNALISSLPRIGAAERQAIAGTQHRLAIVAESDVGALLAQMPGTDHVDLLAAVRGGDVVYFDLNADTRPHLARMIGAAIVMDLVSVTAALQRERHVRPTALLFDDVQAFAAPAAMRGIASLFARGRSAGMMLLLGTQSLADLDGGERHGTMDQLLDNRGTLIVHRLPGRSSAERASRELGDRETHTLSEHLEGGPGRWRPRDRATRTPSREPFVPAGELAGLPTGTAVVGAGGQPPLYVRVSAPGLR
ncbi:MAG: DUF853 family protein [Acidobacteriota bacterium]|nr:DUF853 family protein [Acidobacteriota bacterium]